MREIINFDSPNLTKIKKKSKNITKCHDSFTTFLFLVVICPNMIFYFRKMLPSKHFQEKF